MPQVAKEGHEHEQSCKETEEELGSQESTRNGERVHRDS
jgi:hypothetical protein